MTYIRERHGSRPPLRLVANCARCGTGLVAGRSSYDFTLRAHVCRSKTACVKRCETPVEMIARDKAASPFFAKDDYREGGQ